MHHVLPYVSTLDFVAYSPIWRIIFAILFLTKLIILKTIKFNQYSTRNLPVSAIYCIILSSIAKEVEFFKNFNFFNRKLPIFETEGVIFSHNSFSQFYGYNMANFSQFQTGNDFLWKIKNRAYRSWVKSTFF